MKFRNKILLAIWGVVLSLLIVTFVIINYWMRIQIQSRFTEELHSNYSTISELSELRSAANVKACQIIAETPRLKAVAELRDVKTALPVAQEMTQNMAADLFILTDSTGRPLAVLLKGKPSVAPVPDLQRIVRGHQVLSASNVWELNGSVFRVASAPVVVGNDTVGTVTIGFGILRDDLDFVKTMTGSDAALVLGRRLVTSSLVVEEEQDVADWLVANGLDRPAEGHPSVFTVRTPHERYAATLYPMNRRSSPSDPLIVYLLLKPIDREVRAAVAPVLNTFMVLSLIVLVVTGGIGYVISSGINRPIAALVRGTTEIMRGNYDYRIGIRTGGELKFLAQKFEEMSTSLSEKISQLGERNVELERALRQLKETEQELVKSERLAATGKLTAQLSHEINNPIHNIQSCLQTALKRSPPDAPERELIEVAYEEVGRLSKLTRQMLDFTRTSMMDDEGHLTNLNDVIREVLAASKESFQQAGIEVNEALDPSIGAVMGSPDRLKQVFLNLFLNAKDAMPSGGTLRVGTWQRDGKILVDVSDTGIGIAPENINRVFDAFFTTKSKVSGVGLGLSVTYGIVRQHKGTITVRSALDEGTTFALSFPVALPPEGS